LYSRATLYSRAALYSRATLYSRAALYSTKGQSRQRAPWRSRIAKYSLFAPQFDPPQTRPTAVQCSAVRPTAGGLFPPPRPGGWFDCFAWLVGPHTAKSTPGHRNITRLQDVYMVHHIVQLVSHVETNKKQVELQRRPRPPPRPPDWP
jgi:hypothetical protein